MPLAIMQDGSERIGYDDPAFPVYVKTGDLAGFPNMAALCHWHEELEILMPVKGHLCYSINGCTVMVQEGDAVFVNSRQLHYGFSQDGTDCIYRCIVFLPQLLCANQEIQNRFVLPLVSSPSVPYVLLRSSLPEHQPILDAIKRTVEAAQEHSLGYEMRLMASLYELWRGLFRVCQDQVGEEVSSDSNVMIQKKMLDYIRTHYAEKIKVDDIAAAGGVCRTKCWQIFRRYLGQSPNDYLTSFRLEKGLQLLTSTRLSVTEIASECGFSSSSYFTELFTRQKGCTPLHIPQNVKDAEMPDDFYRPALHYIIRWFSRKKAADGLSAGRWQNP